MNPVKALAYAAVALLAGAACSTTPPPRPPPQGATNMQPAPPQMQDQGWATLVEADREATKLEAERDSTPDPFVQDAIAHQIEQIRAESQALTDEMTVGDGKSHDAQIQRLAANLQRAMQAGAATEMQGGATVTSTPAVDPSRAH